MSGDRSRWTSPVATAAIAAAASLIGVFLGGYNAERTTRLELDHAAEIRIADRRADAYQRFAESLYVASGFLDLQGPKTVEDFDRVADEARNAHVELAVYGSTEAKDAATDALEVVGDVLAAQRTGDQEALDKAMTELNRSVSRFLAIAAVEVQREL